MSAESDYWERHFERVFEQRLMKLVSEAAGFMTPAQIRDVVKAALCQ